MAYATFEATHHPNKGDTPMDRQPLTKIGAMVGAVMAVLQLLVVLGWVELTPEQLAAVLVALTAAGTAATVILGMKEVTPVSDPRDNDGNQLVSKNAKRQAELGDL